MSVSTIKSTLAKLLAQENLNVEIQPVKTAKFDLTSRTLILPVMAETASDEICTLFIAHEVGHALYTPTNGWYDALKGVRKGILNIMEDARIERMVKQKYPGLRTDFLKGYTELLEKMFFGVSIHKLDTLNFVDRMNIHAKVGGHLGIKFSPEEYVYVFRMMKTESFEDVIELSKEVEQFIIEERERKEKEYFDEMFDLDEESDYKLKTDFNGDDGGEESEFESNKDSNDDDEVFDIDSGSMGGLSEYVHDEERYENLSDEVEDDLESETMAAFERNFVSLLDESSKPIKTLQIPKVNCDDYIVDYKTMIARFNAESHTKLTDLDRKSFIKFRKSSLPVVSYLVKEFELKKNAAQLKKASISNTGDLNENMLYAYKFSDDIFKKLTVMPDGKNHGLIMYLDWSGSMSKIMTDTIQQCLNLIMFCRKVNIPFEVYAFTSQYYDNNNFPKKHAEEPKLENTIRFNNRSIILMNLFSSKMNSNELSYMSNIMLNWQTYAYGRYTRWMSLGATPLNHAIVVGMDLIPKFRKKYKLQVINTVILTDGDSHDLEMYAKNNYGTTLNCYGLCDTFRNNSRIYLKDDVTKMSVKLESGSHSTTNALMALFKARTGNKIVGIRLTTKFSKISQNIVSKNYYQYSKLFLKNNSVVVPTDAYDKFIVIRANSMKINDTNIKIEDKMTKAKMVSEFKKFRKNRVMNRIILKEFIEVIS